MKTILLALLASCSSMVDAPCLDGYEHTGSECVARTELPDAGTHRPDAPHDGSVHDGPIVTVDGTPDARVDAVTDAAIDASGDVAVDAPPDAAIDAGPTCSLDLSTDPDNCGFCGHTCASGLCSAGHCTGDPYGHIVAIGHDYTRFHNSAARVLGDAIGLGRPYDVGVAFWPVKNTNVAVAIAVGTSLVNRPWHEVAVSEGLPGIDVLVVDAQSSEAAGEDWKPVMDQFLANAGVVIVVEADHKEHLWARGAGLFSADDPVDVTGQALTLTAPTDSVADGVVTPYAAETTTVGFPNLTPAVVAAPDGSTVVMHRVR